MWAESVELITNSFNSITSKIFLYYLNHVDCSYWYYCNRPTSCFIFLLYC